MIATSTAAYNALLNYYYLPTQCFPNTANTSTSSYYNQDTDVGYFTTDGSSINSYSCKSVIVQNGLGIYYPTLSSKACSGSNCQAGSVC